MRILHIIGTLNPESGGPAAAVSTLVHVGAPGAIHEAVTLDDPDALFLKKLEFLTTALGPTRTKYGYNSKLLPWLKGNAERFDGVVVHGLWQYCGLATWRVFGGRKPYMVFAHGMLDPYFKRTFPFKHLKKWLYWIAAEYWVLRGAYRVLFTCSEEERLARQSFALHRWTGEIVPLGATVPLGNDADHRRAFLNRFPELQQRRFLLFLGRIDRKKGCDLLVDAFIAAAGLDPLLDLVLAGPDAKDWRGELGRSIARAGLASRVHWTGMLQGEEKWGVFLCCEAFILPSHQENFGIAVAEAMACGKAVLLSDKVNIAPEIATAGAGLMESDTADGTFRLIAAWIAMSAEDRAGMAAKARQLFEDRYDLRAHARDLVSLLHRPTLPPLPELRTPASAAE